MTSPVVWAILWWACCHVTWLEAIRQSTEISPQDQIDSVIDRAIKQMGAFRDLHHIKHDWRNE